MRTYTHTVAGTETTTHFLESRADLSAFEDFLARGDKVLGLDTETTGLDIYARDFACRLVQFGNDREAYVLDAQRFPDAIRKALRQPRGFVVHNAPFDLQVLDKVFGVTIEELADRVIDTRILAHLLDPRARHEGGTGLGLKDLASVYVDPDAPDTQAGLHSVFRSIRNPVTGKPCTKRDGWRYIPLDHPTYVLYAGLDVILAVRLLRELAPLVKDLELSRLSKFEHHLQALLACVERRGMRLDVPYIERLIEDLDAEAERYRREAARYGVTNVNSPAQITAALIGMGEDLTETTDSGALKADKGVLLPLADLDNGWNPIGARTPNPLAGAVLRAKRAEKWKTAYAEAFLELRDPDDRLHPGIHSLQARTARMSVSRPPLQQLPSTDWRIRRAVIADPGHVFISADYSQVELRVLGALADVAGIKEAVRTGQDLHGFTAQLVYGPGYTPFQRNLMKGVGFGKVYGGGASALARQTGAPLEAVKSAIAEYDRVFPEIRRYARKLQRRAEYGKKEVVTPSGRHLPLDRDRLYAATNYVVQSTARDVLAQAIVDVHDAGLGDYLVLPIHDELLMQAPEKDAEELAREVGRIMTREFYGVLLEAEGEVTGRNWGAAYGAPALEGAA